MEYKDVLMLHDDTWERSSTAMNSLSKSIDQQHHVSWINAMEGQNCNDIPSSKLIRKLVDVANKSLALSLTEDVVMMLVEGEEALSKVELQPVAE